MFNLELFVTIIVIMILLGIIDAVLYQKTIPWYFRIGISTYERIGKYTKGTSLSRLEQSIEKLNLNQSSGNNCRVISDSEIAILEKKVFKNGFRIPNLRLFSSTIRLDLENGVVELTGRLKWITLISYMTILVLLLVLCMNVDSPRVSYSAIKLLFSSAILVLFVIPSSIYGEVRKLNQLSLFLDKELGIVSSETIE